MVSQTHLRDSSSRIKNNISKAIKNIIIPKTYILKVKPKVSADKPTRAGPNITPVNEILVT